MAIRLGARRQPRAHHSPASHRRPRAGAARRHGRHAARSLVIRSADRVDRAAAAVRHRVAERAECRQLSRRRSASACWRRSPSPSVPRCGSPARDAIEHLKQHAGEDLVRRRWKFLPRNPLVAVQIGCSLALLTAAFLFMRGAGKAASIETGLQPGASILVELDASLSGYDRARARGSFTARSRSGSRALPGVESASVSATVPFGMVRLARRVQPRRRRADTQPLRVYFNSVGADYFDRRSAAAARARLHRRGGDSGQADLLSRSSMTCSRRSSGRMATRSASSCSSPAKQTTNDRPGEIAPGRADRSCRHRAGGAQRRLRESSRPARFTCPSRAASRTTPSSTSASTPARATATRPRGAAPPHRPRDRSRVAGALAENDSRST